MIQTASRLLTVLLSVSLLAPSIALAEEGTRPFQNIRDRVEKRMDFSSTTASTTPRGIGGQNFCTNVDRATDLVLKAYGHRKGKKEDRRDKKDERLVERRGIHDGRLDDRRGDRDENRDDRYERLYDRATTTEQTAAVDAFKAAIEAAVDARRAAVDQAITDYRTGVDALIAAERAKVDTATTTLRAAVEAAVAKAKADCASGVDSAAVRENFKNDLKAANDAFRAAAKHSEDLDDKVKVLRDTRTAAIRSAMETFKTAYKAAVDALKAALGIGENDDD